MNIRIAEQIACVEREIKMRQSVYPRWVSHGRMSYVTSQREIAAMQAVLETLRKLEADQSLFPDEVVE